MIFFRNCYLIHCNLFVIDAIECECMTNALKSRRVNQVEQKIKINDKEKKKKKKNQNWSEIIEANECHSLDWKMPTRLLNYTLPVYV